MSSTILQIAMVQMDLSIHNKNGLTELQRITCEADEAFAVSIDAYLLASIGPLIISLKRSMGPEKFRELASFLKLRHNDLIDDVAKKLEEAKV